MRSFLALLLLALGCVACSAQTYKCLGSQVKESDVSDVRLEMKNGQQITEKITVRDVLKQLKARCRGNKLVDGKGKQIRFFFVHNCWGNPPENYLELLEKQQKELEKLKRSFTVIQMTCNPTGIPPQ